jgi:dTDP-4-amino-4,6-dideoxygalactose transaminase
MFDKKIIPFHKHNFGKEEINAVSQVLKNKWITGGPVNIKFEKKLQNFLQSNQVLTVASATSALFLCLQSLGLKPDDEVITSPYSFIATTNVILQNGAKIVFADIADNYLLNPEKILPLINQKTKAILCVDYGGYPCDYKTIHQVLKETKKKFKPTTNLIQKTLGRPLILADSAHSFGSLPKNLQEKNQADIHCYSFHAVKNITCAEGGAISIVNQKLKNTNLEKNLKQARLHGLTTTAYERKKNNPFYDMTIMGYKCNLTEIQAALGIVQLSKLTKFKQKKLAIQKQYDECFINQSNLKIKKKFDYENSWTIHPHLYTLEYEKLTPKNHTVFDQNIILKKKFFKKAKILGVDLNFHYKPIPTMKFYQKQSYNMYNLTNTKKIYPKHFSLPFYTQLTKTQIKIICQIILQLKKQ